MTTEIDERYTDKAKEIAEKWYKLPVDVYILQGDKPCAWLSLSQLWERWALQGWPMICFFILILMFVIPIIAFLIGVK